MTSKGNIVFVAVPSLIPLIQLTALPSLDRQFLMFRNIGWMIKNIWTFLFLSCLCYIDSLSILRQIPFVL